MVECPRCKKGTLDIIEETQTSPNNWRSIMQCPNCGMRSIRYWGKGSLEEYK
jgi:C4-type Zn-finger protein